MHASQSQSQILPYDLAASDSCFATVGHFFLRMWLGDTLYRSVAFSLAYIMLLSICVERLVHLVRVCQLYIH